MENEICHLKLEDIIPKEQRPYDNNYDYIEQDLVESIKKHGIIQPIIVKEIDSKYKIIDGNRRYYASLKGGLNKIPAFIRNNVEGITRIDLNDKLYNQELSPIEEAKKYKEILETSNITQEELANRIGKSQSALANKLRLLNLPLEIQNALNSYEISERHARSLLTVKNKDIQLELLKKIKKEKITVRELDSEIKNMSNMFIPEEFSNKNNSFNQSNESNSSFGFNGNMDNNFNNKSTNMFIPQSNNVLGNSQNTFMPNNNYENFSTGNNSSFDLPTNNGGMNPFLTSNNYMPPMPNNNDQNSFNNNVNNPFSNIRMNTNNMNNDSNSNPFFVNNSENNDISNDNQFNINDYKLPEYDNVSNNSLNEQSSYNQESMEQPNSKIISIPNDYKYVEDNPNYVSVDNPLGVSSVDDVINVLRGALDKIKNGKIKVDTEEIDFDDNYQITIRIDKKGDFL